MGFVATSAVVSVDWEKLGNNPSLTKIAPVREPAKEDKMSGIVFDHRTPRGDYGQYYFDQVDKVGKGELVSTQPGSDSEVS